jgi:hypothetical protein
MYSAAPKLGIQISKVWNKGSKESWHAIYAGKDLMVKMGKLVQKFEHHFFRMNSLKMVKQITSPKSAPKLPLKSNLVP